MRPTVIVLVGFAILGLSAVSARAEKNASTTEASLAGGQVAFYPDGDRCELSLGVGRGDAGGTIGIDGIGYTAFRNVVGTCEEAAAALVVAIPPAPLCVTYLQSGSNMRLNVVCSGPRDRVVGAIGVLAKAMLLLP